MLPNIDLFLLMAQHGSFTAAATATNLSAVTLARRINDLEADLGMVLFLRGKNGLSLTAQGAALRDRVAPIACDMATAVAAARQEVLHLATAPIRISATEPVIAEVLAPRLGQLLARHDLPIVLQVENRPVDLSRYEAEIALRFAKPQGNSLRVRRVGTFAMSFWAHTSYDQTGADRRFVGFDDTYGEIPERECLRQAGVMAQTTIQTSSTRATLEVIRSGIAIGILPDIIAGRIKDLVRVEGILPVPARPLWLMLHPDVARRPAVRQVIDWLADTFQDLRR